MTASATPHEVGHVRDRVRLYLLVMLVIDLAAYASDAVDLWILDKPTPQLHLHYAVLRWVCTGFLVAGWALTRFGNPGRIAVIALESALTLALVAVYIALGNAYIGAVMPAYAPAFSLMGILLLLSVRAAMVPSPLHRTLVIGAASFGWWLGVTDDARAELDPVVRDGLHFMGGALVIATAVTSRVIYGLRAQVRDAMRLGQYQLGRKLGEGGMGVVYEATHLMLRRPTAVKLLPIDRAGERTIARFEREVQQTSRLEHPNSVYIYDYGRTPDGQFYYAMEYLDGVTLQQLVELDGAIDVDRAVAILGQAARALAEAHELGLVHRDIKPANIMLCERAGVADTVKVLDFGLVKAIDDPVADGLTHADAVVGTPHYLAPEAITRPDEVGPAADVYALGAVAFFLVTGRDLFPGSSVIEVCSKHLEATPESPSTVRGEAIDAGLEALILRCLDKRPDHRPADGAALAAELDRLDMTGWTADHAARWWREHPELGAARAAATPVEPTRLAVDVRARRQ